MALNLNEKGLALQKLEGILQTKHASSADCVQLLLHVFKLGGKLTDDAAEKKTIQEMFNQ